MGRQRILVPSPWFSGLLVWDLLDGQKVHNGSQAELLEQKGAVHIGNLDSILFLFSRFVFHVFPGILCASCPSRNVNCHDQQLDTAERTR